MYKVKTLMTPDHTAFEVRRSWPGRAEIGRSSEGGLSIGRHKKAPVCSPRSLLATLHGAPRTHDLHG